MDNLDYIRIQIGPADLAEKVRDYVAELETHKSNDVCMCQWIIHPDDTEIDPYNCATCGHPNLMHMSGDDSYCTKTVYGPDDLETGLPSSDAKCECPEWKPPRKRRMRRGETNLECPVHTREGFILGFFKWLEKHA